MKNSLLLGTSNAGKLQEFIFYIEHFSLFENFQIHDLNDFKDLGEPIEDGKTFKKNAEIKSKYFLEKTNSLVLCDDSGFIVNDLKDYPGINTAREARKMGGEQKVIDFIFSKFENLNYIASSFFCELINAPVKSFKLQRVITTTIAPPGCKRCRGPDVYQS